MCKMHQVRLKNTLRFTKICNETNQMQSYLIKNLVSYTRTAQRKIKFCNSKIIQFLTLKKNQNLTTSRIKKTTS